MRHVLPGLALAAVGAWLRALGQRPFEPMLTHDRVGRVLLQDAAAPWDALVGALGRLAGETVVGLALPDLLLAAGLLLIARAGTPWKPPARLDLPAAILGALMATALAAGLFGFEPYGTDEFSYRFQARLFASGRLTAESPLPLAAFQSTNLVSDGQWYSQYPPGWSLVMAPFQAVPWLIPALLGAGALLFPYRLARQLYGPEAAAFTLLILAASPALLMNAATLFPHAAQVALGCAALELLLRGRGAAGGALLGLVFLMRPLETALLALLVPFAVRDRGTLVPAALGFAAVASLFAGWLLHLRGGFYETAAAVDPESLGHSLPAALWNTAYRLVRLGFWAAPLALLLALKGPQRVLTAGYLVVLTAAFAFFYNLGQVEFSTRYLLLGWVLLTLPAGAAAARHATPGAVLVWLLVSLAAVWPGMVSEARATVAGERQMWGWLREQAAGGALVLVRNTPNRYAKGFVRNEPDLRGPLVMALFLDPETNAEVRRRHAELPAALLDFDFSAGSWRLLPAEGQTNPEDDLLVAGINFANSVGDRKKALETWRRIPDGSPYGVAARMNEARLLFRMGHWEEMLQAIRGVSPSPDLRLMEGQALWHSGRRDEARKVFQDLLADPAVGAQARAWLAR